MTWSNGIKKIDDEEVLGLAGTPNSLAYKVEEIEKHFHNKERWLCKANPQTATDWAVECCAAGAVLPYVAISGSNNFGGDANDEALIFGTDDLLNIDGETKLDLHRIMVTDASSTTVYILRIVYGTGTMANAITAKQFTTVPVISDPAAGGGYGNIIDVKMPRLNIGTDKIWIQIKNATDNATLSFICGFHGYTH